MPSSSLCSHALVLDTQGFGAFGNTKANRHKIKNEPGGNDRSPQVNDYVKKFRQSFEKNEDFDKSVGKILNIKYKIYEIKGFLKKNKILSSINDSIKSVRK